MSGGGGGGNHACVKRRTVPLDCPALRGEGAVGFRSGAGCNALS